MQNKPFPKPLVLNINEQLIHFSSANDFSFCMDGRTAVSSNKLSELFKLSIDQLDLQSKKIEEVNKFLFSMITKLVEDTDGIVTVMNELDPSYFSNDHDWRKIILSLNDCDEIFNPVRKIALTKYMQYLSTLDDTIGFIRKDRKALSGEKQQSSEIENPEFGETWGVGHLLSDLQNDSGTLNDFKQLPKDKAVEFRLAPGKHIDILLASYFCQIASKDNHIQYIDNERVVNLNMGRNIIGRSNNSTVQIKSTQKDVSRSHLAIQVCDSNILQLTDLSSAGSFVPSSVPIP
ncbi:MAG: FHA domain-containing protein [Gammaproteobacteria bacterium]|jgi:hypothetical protein